MSCRRTLVAVASALLACTSATASVWGECSVAGTVVDESGNPVASRALELLGRDGESLGMVRTSFEGRFSFRSVSCERSALQLPSKIGPPVRFAELAPDKDLKLTLLERSAPEPRPSTPSPAGAEPAPTEFGFGGHEMDKETGLIYFGARYYDPKLGRFLTPDPVRGYANDPPTSWTYAYARANPLRYIDPTGKYAEDGHYYVTFIAALRTGFTPAEAQTLAYYAQLPDEVPKLDAIEVQKRNFFFGSDDDREARRDYVQPLLHALTGGDARTETLRTIEAIRRTTGLGATGLLLHRLGDTFAHRTLAGEGVLYARGLGHIFDVDADVIQYRPSLFQGYLRTLVSVLGEKRGLDDATRTRLADGLQSTLQPWYSGFSGASGPSEEREVSVAAIRQALFRELRASGVSKEDLARFDWKPEEHSIEHVGVAPPGSIDEVARSLVAAGGLKREYTATFGESEVARSIEEAMIALTAAELAGAGGSFDPGALGRSRARVISSEPRPVPSAVTLREASDRAGVSLDWSESPPR